MADYRPVKDAPPPVPIACGRCGRALGVSTGGAVEFGAVRVCQRVVLTCVACGRKRSWRPTARD